MDHKKGLKMRKLFPFLLLVTALATGVASAQWTFQANLTGLGENPPNASPATGFGQVVLNAPQTMIRVEEVGVGRPPPPTASHIHGPGGVGKNAPVLSPFSGGPAATAGS